MADVLMPEVVAPSALCSDAALAEQAAHCGRMLGAAYTSGDRALALVWQQAMYGIVKLRQARRYGMDTQPSKGDAA